jgi:peptidoglycan hydrolase-like protein with peptidoglycan-binding domain
MTAPGVAPTTPSDQPRTYSDLKPVSSVQQWLLNLGAPRTGLVSKTTGQPDGIYGTNTDAALKKIAKGMGYSSVMASASKDKRSVAISPPELVSALIEGTSGRMTTGVETSKETQLVEAKKEAAVAPTRKEMAKDVVDSINAYIKKHKKAPKESFSRVKQYQKLAGFSGKNLDGKWGPATRTAVAQDLNVAENSLPASAFDKKVVAAPKTVSLKDRAEKARNAVLNYIERKGRPPAIVVAEVSDFQRAVIGDKKFDSKYRKSIKRADGKYGPDTRGAMADAMGVDQKELPITAFDKGAPKVQPTREDKIEEQVEIKNAEVHANEDKANGAAVVTDTSAVKPISPTSSAEITASQTDADEPMPTDGEEAPWYKQPKYLIGGGIALALGFGVMSGMRKKSRAGLPAGV